MVLDTIGTLTHTLSQGGWTALMRAAIEGHADCVRLLLDAGADKDARHNVRMSVGVVCGSGGAGAVVMVMID